MNAVSEAKAGVASGILSMNRMIGGTLGIAILGAVFQALAPAGTTDPSKFIHAFTTAMWVATGVAFVGALTAMLTLRGKAAQGPSPARAEAEAFAAPEAELATASR
jgi:molecular chaperone DnaK (HSP70)